MIQANKNRNRMKLNIFFSILVSLIFFADIAVAQNISAEEKSLLNKGKKRDQKAIEDAVEEWWTASMKNHDQRIDWWRKAKFGMFIHWGIYSLPGGEWKGNKVNGYAEHLMRKEKIPRT